MSRRLSVLLPDGRRLLLAPAPIAELRRLAAEALNVAKDDADLFGCAVEDEKGQLHWLRDERTLREQGSPEEIIYRARFFVDSVLSLSSAPAVEMFFIAIYTQLSKGQLVVPSGAFHRFMATLLQVLGGNMDRQQAVALLDHALPASLRPRDEPSLLKILDIHEKQRGTPRGLAMIRFLQQAEGMPHYGCHFYSVSRLDGAGCQLGVCAGGIVVSSAESLEEFRLFDWQQLDNLYFKEDKFTLEVRDGRRRQEQQPVDDDELSEAVKDPTTQVSSTRRSVRLHSFLCDSSALCRAVWHAAITQHQFHLDRRHQRTRPPSDHGERLGRLISNSSLCSSLPSLSSLHASSLPSMPAAKVCDGSSSSLPSLKGRSEEEMAKARETFTRLKARRLKLENDLREKMKELLVVCLREGEITGELPKETKKALMPGEDLPKLKRRIRVGTSFSIPEELIKGDRANRLVQLETDVELHRKIVAAAERLAKDKSMNKSVRKKRQKDLVAAAQKLKGLELGLSQLRLSASKPDVSSLGSNGSSGVVWMAKSCPTTPHGSVPDLLEKNDDEEDSVVQRRAPSEGRRSLRQRFSEASSSSSSLGLPPSGNSRRSFTQRSITSDELDNPLASPIYENVGYRSTCYRSSYRQAHYPTLQDEQRKRSVSAHSVSREHIPSVPVPAPAPRRLPTSVSCGAGFAAATSSLDRRELRSSSSKPSISQGSPSTQRVTTFPVSQNLSYDNCLPIFQRPSLAHFPARGALPSFHSVSSGRLQATTNSHMEALLEYYKAEARKAPPKTATIV